MTLVDRFVQLVLCSPVHPLLSGSTDLIRYTGHKSGKVITTPTQYARHGDDVVLIAGHPDTKTWWHNFTEERPLELRLQGAWVPMTGQALVGTDHPEDVADLVQAFIARFPRTAKALAKQGVAKTVVVRCRPAG